LSACLAAFARAGACTVAQVLTGKLRSRRTVFCAVTLVTSVIFAPFATWSSASGDAGGTPQTITFPAIPDKTMRDSGFTISASSSSGLPVAFTALTPATCSLVGVNHNIVSPDAPGTCTIEADQSGEGTAFAAAPPVPRSFAIVKAPQSISFAALSDVALSIGFVFVSATSTTGGQVTFSTSTPSVCTASGTDGEVDLVAAGTCTVNADQAGGDLDAAAPTVSRSFTVTRAAQAITFATIPDHVVSDPPFAISATSTSLLAVTFAASPASVCTIDGATITLGAAGNCSVVASQAGDANTDAAAPITRTFKVTPAAQTISFAALPGKSVTDPSFTVVATASSGLVVTFTTTTPAVCTSGGANGETIALIGSGTCTVEADQPGNASFAAADAAFQSFTVTKVDQTITFATLASRSLAQSPVPLTATASSGLAVTFTSQLPAVCTVLGTSVTLVAVGTCTIQADQAGNGTYKAAPAIQQAFAVTPAPKSDQTITFAALPDIAISATLTAVATASSGLTVTFSSTTPTVCTATGTNGSTVTRVTVGACTIQADQSGDATHNAAPPVLQTLGVAKTNQTITFAPLPNIALDHAPVTVTATSTSLLPVSFTTTTPTVCTAGGTNGATITIVAAGVCTVRADQPGTVTVNAAPTVAQSFTVTKLAQTITFATPAHTTVAHSPVTVVATASSHLTVTFATTTPLVCKAGGTNGAKITLLGGGTCAVRATQAGDATFAAAPPVVRQFVVDGPVVSTSQSGYWMLGADGHVYAFGSATDFGSASDPAVALAARHDGAGYWVVDRLGNVHAFGSAAYHGGHPALLAGESVSTISATPSGNGYWLFTSLGRAFAFGDAHFFGDMRAVHLNGPIVASVATPTGRGYYMVGSDGGVFSFGDAHFHGSMGAAHLNQPIVGLSPTPDNRGYWLVASDGGVFAFGAPFRGSLGRVALNKPVNGLVAFGNGYLMVASDGGVFNFSNKRFVGSLGGKPIPAPIVGIATNGSA
jgi:hypothetical protein